MARLFIAVWPPSEVVDLINTLERVEADGVRFTEPDQWHVTMRFFGEIDVSTASVALRSVQANSATAVLGPLVSRLGSDVIVAPASGLDRMAEAVRRATAAVGAPPDSRPFVGHLTLARTRQAESVSLIGATISGEFRVDELALVQSPRDNDGAGYETIATHRLLA